MTLALRVVPVGVLVAVLVAVAALGLGRPDLAVAGSLMSGGYPTMAAAVAIVSLIVWLLIAGIAISGIAWALRTVVEEASILRHRWVQAAAVLVTGLLILGVGLVRHYTVPYSICCGNAQEVTQLAR